ncbi:MAG: PEGA domain-containing protein [Synergistaceae bacterium]|nr:PEGA domain-containing protein [Candidatus Equadaptatus faecalis]
MEVKNEKIISNIQNLLFANQKILSDKTKLKGVIGDYVYDADLKQAMRELIELDFAGELLSSNDTARLKKIAQKDVDKVSRETGIDRGEVCLAANMLYKIVKAEANELLENQTVAVKKTTVKKTAAKKTQTVSRTQAQTVQPQQAYAPSPVQQKPKKHRLRKFFKFLLLLSILGGVYDWYDSTTKGELVINGVNGKLYVEGAFVSDTPCKISLKEGTYNVKVASGNKYWKDKVYVTAKNTIEPDVEMTEAQTKKTSARTVVPKMKETPRQTEKPIKSAAQKTPQKTDETKETDEAEEARRNIDKIMSGMQSQGAISAGYASQPEKTRPENKQRKTAVRRTKKQNISAQKTAAQKNDAKEAAKRRREENLRRIRQENQ